MAAARRNLERDRARRALARVSSETDARALAAAVQAALGYVPRVAFGLIAERAGASEDAVGALAESDPTLRAAPPGRHRVTICSGRTCARRGGAGLIREARRSLGVGVFETTADDAIRLEPFRCFGQCAMAPNVLIDGSIRGAMTSERLLLLLDMLRRKARAAAEAD